ncbi:hypothetical protein [Streptomyces sp. MUM 16J]|uniref:hypothetical protein n=1 Tax=Streptomyces sp. MUM 16J TaxID=2791988 RepID=UPI0005831DD2|nr:hypothetical protein [Streptomyces sp. MUM 16J]MCH0557411.1 hypothetical protein [Streptomyces sp. MUM 16J]
MTKPSTSLRNPRRSLLLPLTGLGSAAVLALSGCGTHTQPVSAQSTLSSTSGPASTSAPATASASASAPGTTRAVGTTLTLDEHANRTTVHVARGSTVSLVLHSTLWPALKDSAPALLQPLGKPAVTHDASCVTGGGCGTQTTRYLAHKPGTVVLSDHRTSCGEAKLCTPAQASFTVTVVIG